MARRTKEDAQATRAALLDAAERVFQERGVSRTTLAEIATEAGVTRGALYWHFKDKADLFNAMMERVILPLESDWKALQESQGDPLPIWRSHLQRALWRLVHDEQTRRVLQIAMQKVEHTPEMNAVVEHHIQTHRARAECEREVLEQAARVRGIHLPAPAPELAQGMHAMVHGLIYSWLLDRSFDLLATAKASIDAFLHGIGLGPDKAG